MQHGVVKKRMAMILGSLSILAVIPCACSRAPKPSAQKLKPRVLAIETFLADVAGRVAGDELAVGALLPVGADPHEYEPTPMDIAKVSDAALVIANGAGFEGFLGTLVRNVSTGGKSGGPKILEASGGLTSRSAREGEAAEAVAGQGAPVSRAPREPDPHFFLDPLSMIRYVENIRDAFCALDAAGAARFQANAAAYGEELRALDRWISAQVDRIPARDRMLVTNHESLGYFADRYGFTILGTILPSVSSDASPGSRQIVLLTERLKGSGVKAIFLETGAAAVLAEQVAREAGIRTVTALYTHSLSGPAGPAPTYIDMMKFDVKAIVEGLTGSGGEVK
jgi:ABC-type Zn uptake system ZnuABC Zn-binding protein ZnuA